MDEKILETAMGRFDASITKFEQKHGEQVESLQDRLELLEQVWHDWRQNQRQKSPRSGRE